MSDPAVTTLRQATAIVIAYLARHDVPPAKLPALVAEVRAAVERELTPANEPVPGRKLRPLRATSDPAVPIAESVTPDYLVSLETGQQLKVLEKHLKSFGLTPAAYRARWGLPADYPMVAPRFGAWRSDYDRLLGLGKVPRLSTEA
ncbi:MucR family transcriptional regulator [Aureimonas phyllosphaerae]|uniref:Putative transcriptional regulator n=1 Tax=Aureimonas phyllosphaerae TaxID=1166078 RepID=A0A7W6FWE7_9HYPH|nr:MucR family transcriptional regulator [Aureimonas phyllosphaerae]MBB3938148.1 putative transcriptional regulator [Aureimonas phyllosphaerae]MBB3962156.1 putative transcriptional regulator [Aureimonas phyllosphaerae]SFF56663.1 transcriptional regulator, MucR family [Aureimonas phyllosphaerae]